jgi:hypothetical protein
LQQFLVLILNTDPDMIFKFHFVRKAKVPAIQSLFCQWQKLAKK